MSDAIDTTWHDLMQPNANPAADAILLTDLPDRRVIEVTGSEARAFLHAILTQDINAVSDEAASFSALCTAKGRALGLLRIAAHDDRFHLITRAELAPGLLKRLQMYVLRRDVQLSLADDQAAMGIIWPGETRSSDCPFDDAEACAAIERLAQADPTPGRWPTVVDARGCLYLREDKGTSHGMRVAVHGPTEALKAMLGTAPDSSAIVASDHWERAEIEDRIPEVTGETAEHFVPQWINLDELDAFSLKKGCYPGQEVIARMHYLGKPNRRLFAGHVLGLAAPAAGTPVKNDRDETAGEVVRSAPLPDESGSLVLTVIKLKHLHDSLSIDGLALSLDPHDTIEGGSDRAGARH
ncbi:folate-binding protein YgfZ [Guyparkeria sp. SB14A]|uniref:CAF17-like 4Fe-4S cluster assembly/insertion protein YgfZ n=1 Tax=Guyparkeria sp. SB14A TaxID=2571147 RepID=UPI0010AC781C|nr:folate-binding protein YgfZ [Guyparkeria sp. SB14A]TKA90085.1 folate-binding protein YgfZ [Guyparkeria sp. SB14A]